MAIAQETSVNLSTTEKNVLCFLLICFIPVCNLLLEDVPNFFSSVVQELLSYRESVVKDCERSRPTPLHLACKGGHEDVVKVFIKAGVDLDST